MEKTMSRIKSLPWFGLVLSALLIAARLSGEDVLIQSPYHTDPNSIVFRLEVLKAHLANSSATMSIVVEKGNPSSAAVLVDRKDFTNAIWEPYMPSVSANLGTNEGTHVVWVGLRGGSATSE